MKIKTILTIFLGILLTGSCFAGINISPVKVKLTNKEPRALIHLKNTGTVPLMFKTGIAVKKKKGARTTFVAIKNSPILAVPKVIRLKAGDEKTVRFALRKKVKKSGTYYLTLFHKATSSEVTLATKGKVNPNVILNVQLDIPIVVSP